MQPGSRIRGFADFRNDGNDIDAHAHAQRRRNEILLSRHPSGCIIDVSQLHGNGPGLVHLLNLVSAVV
jgi:hypothetical protein